MIVKKKNRVLAIDDEPSMIEWLKILLEHEGYEVRTAMKRFVRVRVQEQLVGIFVGLCNDVEIVDSRIALEWRIGREVRKSARKPDHFEQPTRKRCC